MMFVDHVATALAIPICVPRLRTRGALVAAGACSLLPDVPAVLSGGPGTLGYLAHRDASHAAVWVAVAAFAGAAVAVLLRRRAWAGAGGPVAVGAMAAWGVASHLLLDWATEYGTRWLWPFSDALATGSVFHSFDPAWMAASSLFLGWTARSVRRGGLPSRRSAAAFLAVVVAFTAFALARKSAAAAEWDRYVADRLAGFEVVETVPRTFWRWKGIARGGDRLAVVAPTPDGVRHAVFASAAGLAAGCPPDGPVAAFLRYSRYPVVLEDGGGRLGLANLVYSTRTYRLDLDRTGPCTFAGFDVSGFDVLDPLPELGP